MNDQYITIDPEFREELKRRNDSNIDEFLSLPELIPAKKRRKQKALLDYTKSIILTSRDYIKGLEELLAKKEATTVATQKKRRKRQARSNANYSENNNKKRSKIA